ncbi:serine/threonine-protein phosphatase [Nonomuraea sp. FMUSA5-5]|uniref:Serine/threonine-protein phosphatase n=1 Tax=Nonomuraea composti TaxID=2720023 RepID=A0ABX1BA49_9ACTN|nr:PP2C family protein-serine/threonine phosphatase [Nonomuraea sp. FMUSA5-5]NJP93194.1 serine/threonine-protein phosphatase [Nonomuraea sp. FMUSA5-5]
MTSRSQRWILPSILLAEVAVAVADEAAVSVSMSGLLLIGPLVAAHCLLSPRLTTLAAGTALALAVLLLVIPDGSGLSTVPDHLIRVLLVATSGLWAVLTARTYREYRIAVTRLARLAETTQRAISPPMPAELGGLNLAARTRSATPGARLGGDLHEAIATPTGLRLIVGDAKGHGIDALSHAAAVLAAFRRSALTAPDLTCLARQLDTRLAGELGEEDFVTVLLAEFGRDHVTLVNCGHPPPIRIGATLDTLVVRRPSPPLGLSPDPYPQRVRLLPTDRLLLYTDGLTEARAPGGAFFRLDERLHAVLAAPTLDQALDELLDALDEHTEGPVADDDLTLVLAQAAPSTLLSPLSAPVFDDRRHPVRRRP